MIRQKDLVTLNDSLSKNIYVAKEDILATFVSPEDNNLKSLLKKGEEVRLWVEMNPQEWVRVKAFDPKAHRETAKGITIFYIFKVDYPLIKEYDSYIRSLIVQKFDIKTASDKKK